jgi:phosphoribosylformylglycinamidine synthase
MVRVLVLRSAGTNCDEETAHAFSLAGGEVERLHAGALLRGERKLDEFHILTFPGGFSYGDDLGSGTILASKLRTRLAGDLKEFVASGRLVIGICNGFQVLVRLGLLPGWDGEKVVSLVENRSGKFEDRWIHLRVDTDICPFLRPVASQARGLGPGKRFRLPVAHKEGRFVAASTSVLDALKARRQIALTYVSGARGAQSEAFAPDYPQNPNGSWEGIAGITNPSGNVLGLMPHPERHLRALHDPTWTRRAVQEGLPADEERSGDGYAFFENAIGHVKKQLLES